jgi:hypothetical protein
MKELEQFAEEEWEKNRLGERGNLVKSLVESFPRQLQAVVGREDCWYT